MTCAPVPAEQPKLAIERRQLVGVEQPVVDRVAENVVVRRRAAHASPSRCRARTSPGRPEGRGGAQTGDETVLVEAEALPGARERGPRRGSARAARPAQRGSNVYQRMLVRDPPDHCAGSISCGAVQRHAVVPVGLEPLEPVEVVGDRRVPSRRRRSRRAGSSRRAARRPRQQRARRCAAPSRSSSIGTRTGAGARRREGPRAAAAPVARWTRRRRRRTPRRVVVGADLDASSRREATARTAAEMQGARRALEQRGDVGPAAAGDRPPAPAAGSRASRGCRRSGARSRRGTSSACAGAARPERGGQRDEEVARESRE